MKIDLDSLLAAKDFDAILVCGPGQHNPDMVYLTGGGHLTRADLIKKRGGETVLFHQSMERDEAARTGLKTCEYNDFPLDELLKSVGGNNVEALALRYKLMLESVDVKRGRLALLGRGQIGSAFAVFNALQRLMPELTLIGEDEESNVLLQARKTKDANEIERIRAMGKITTGVVARVAEFLSSQRLVNGVLTERSGEVVTIGKVKNLINLWLAEAGAENPEGTIFSAGYDAAVPHSTGTNENPLHAGETIIFDIYPCEAGGGYFYDFTRTWCLGYATDEILNIYEDVRSVYQTIVSSMRLDTPVGYYQALTCDLFEQRGYPTIRSHPRTVEGYTHSIGHGIGLNVHELPWSRGENARKEVLRPGMAFTVEPGLYFPEKSIGVRIEDSYWMRPDGLLESFVSYPDDLVLKVKS